MNIEINNKEFAEKLAIEDNITQADFINEFARELFFNAMENN